MIETNKLKSFLKKYGYILLVLYVPCYIGTFFILESIITPEVDYWVSYSPLDDLIPFNEFFIIPYYMWYPFLVSVGLYFMFKDRPEYKRYMYCIMIGFTAALLICFLFPNGQDLRPETFERDNFCVSLVKTIYKTDTNTNVIPSVHVIGALFGAFGLLQTKTIKKKWIKWMGVCMAILISASTCLVKQHSILDVFAGIIVAFVVYAIVYIFIKKKMDNV